VLLCAFASPNCTSIQDEIKPNRPLDPPPG
jgi:hypothetical protein